MQQDHIVIYAKHLDKSLIRQSIIGSKDLNHETTTSKMRLDLDAQCS